MAESSGAEAPAVPDRQAAVIAGLLIVAMVFFGAMAKHDNPSWNRMVGQAKTVLGVTAPVLSKSPDKN